MHIPQCETKDIEILTFENALKTEADGSFEYDREKWLYVPNAYTEYRYILGTRGKNPLICIGINPSTAKPDDLDNTLKSVERTAHFNGYDSFIMFNVYAQPLIQRIWMVASMSVYIKKIWQLSGI